jgi:hypothetical protein
MIHADTSTRTALIQCMCHALARRPLQLGCHDAEAGRGRVAIRSVSLSLHALVPQLRYLTADILRPAGCACMSQYLYV